MPRDLFGDVTRPSISVGNRKWYTLPLSLFSHSAIVAIIIAIPILAPAAMPSVFADDDLEYITRLLPPPPPPPAIRPAHFMGNHQVARLQCRRERAAETDVDDRPRPLRAEPCAQRAFGVARPFAGVEQGEMVMALTSNHRQLTLERRDDQHRRAALGRISDLAFPFNA